MPIIKSAGPIIIKKTPKVLSSSKKSSFTIAAPELKMTINVLKYPKKVRSLANRVRSIAKRSVKVKFGFTFFIINSESTILAVNKPRLGINLPSSCSRVHRCDRICPTLQSCRLKRFYLNLWWIKSCMNKRLPNQ